MIILSYRTQTEYDTTRGQYTPFNSHEFRATVDLTSPTADIAAMIAVKPLTQMMVETKNDEDNRGGQVANSRIFMHRQLGLFAVVMQAAEIYDVRTGVIASQLQEDDFYRLARNIRNKWGENLVRLGQNLQGIFNYSSPTSSRRPPAENPPAPIQLSSYSKR